MKWIISGFAVVQYYRRSHVRTDTEPTENGEYSRVYTSVRDNYRVNVYKIKQ